MALLDSPIDALCRGIAEGRWTAGMLCEEALARIEALDPQIGAMSHVIAESARREATAIDRALSHGEAVGPLAGIPIAIKSNVDTVPAICDAGLPHLSTYRPEADAPVVARLRAAGAVIVGTVETDCGAFGVTTPQVINPRLRDRFAGGSSGGSAAAVAAGFCKAAIGTDTGGSVRIPAACCGVLGFKPSFGRVSTLGVRPLASAVDHVGVLGLSVVDVQRVMEVIDPAFASRPSEAGDSPVIGVAAPYMADALPQVREPILALVEEIRARGYTVKTVELPPPAQVLHSHLVLSLTEASLHYLEHEAEHIALLPEAAKESIAFGRGYSAHDHLRAQRQRHAFLDRLQAVFAEVDLLLLPTMPILAPTRSTTTVRLGDDDVSLLAAMIRHTAPFDQSGHPALAMPWRPDASTEMTSVQLVGALNEDRRLLAWAASLEKRITGLGNATPV